jgi:predicted Zn-dependent protease
MLGLCQFELGANELALKSLRAADKLGIVNNDELRNVALYHLGAVELRTSRFGDAYETLHDLAEKGLQTKELFVALAESALLINPRDNKESDQSILERVGQAESLSAQKKFAESEQMYADLVARSPEFPNLHFAYGRMLLDARKEDDAVREFRRELERDPKNVNSMLEIASVEYQQDSQEGLKFAEQAVKLAPSIPFAHYMLGMLRLDTGDAAGAIPELEMVRKMFPDRSQVYFALGNAYSRVGRKEDAARARAEFTRLDAQAKASQPMNGSSASADRRLWVERKPVN